jgi:Mg/Co/Ni transporter MgtE
MIEANYDFETVIESSAYHKKRSVETHLDIDSVVEFVKNHPSLEEIWLLHLSDQHSDAERFKAMVQDASGAVVYVAGE